MNPDCLRFAPMLSARPGELPRADEEALHLHLAGCDACQARLADGVAVGGLVAEGLLAEAARVDFAPFVDQVMARVGMPSAAPGRRRGLLAWVRGHRLAAAFSALAPAAVAVALALFLTGGEDQAPLAGEVQVEVVSEGRAPLVLSADEGPVVLLGDPAEGS
jgi:anti-sigma factor RsiW